MKRNIVFAIMMIIKGERTMKTIDDRIAELGFTKLEENEYGTSYERYDEQYKYMQSVDIMHKASGKHVLQSYDKDSCTSDLHSSTVVGLTYPELKLFTKKMKKLVRQWKKQDNDYYEVYGELRYM